MGILLQQTRSVVLLILRNVIDELITVYIVLRATCQDETQFRNTLQRLSVRLEVQANGLQSKPLNGPDVSKNNPSSRSEDTLWSGNIDTTRAPTVVVREEAGKDLEHQILAIWKTTIPLSQ